MNKSFPISILAIMPILLLGCSGDPYFNSATITQVCEDGKINVWHSLNTVTSMENGNGYYFTDAKTNKIVIINGGDINITQD